jgi:hypothetical protein
MTKDQFGIENVQIPSNAPVEILKAAVQNEYRYSLLGLIFGAACILGGLILFINGVAGTTNWTVEALGLTSRLNDAAPGAVLVAVGALIVWVTRHQVTVSK